MNKNEIRASRTARQHGNVPCSRRGSEPPVVREAAGLFGARSLLFDELASTNTWVLQHGEQLRHGDAVRAVRQTAGYGRFERQWFVPDDKGLAVTVFLHPEHAPQWLMLRCGFVAALAVRATVAAQGLPAKVKWPNDVLVKARKLAGVLAERQSTRGWIALGMGLNVNLTRADLDRAGLRMSATSLLIETGRTFDIDSLYCLLLRKLERVWRDVESGGPQALARRWRRFDLLRGCGRITIHTPNGSVSGRYLGMDRNGCLAIESGGKELTFHSGDVTLAGTRRA